MKVADENIILFERFSNGARNLSASLPAGIVYAAQRMGNEADEEHDGRGLIIAILLCMACWAALGYFLLA
jgi:hypothetical protein